MAHPGFLAPYWKYPQSLHQCVSMEIALGKGTQVGHIIRIGGDPDVRALAAPASEAPSERPGDACSYSDIRRGAPERACPLLVVEEAGARSM